MQKSSQNIMRLPATALQATHVARIRPPEHNSFTTVSVVAVMFIVKPRDGKPCLRVELLKEVKMVKHRWDRLPVIYRV